MDKEQELRLDPVALEAARRATGTIPGAAYWNDCARIIAAYLAALPSSDEQAEVVGALERGEVLPKLANCGHYLAEDNAGQWHYINHANTWQTYPGPTTPEARAIAYASPAVARAIVDEMLARDERNGFLTDWWRIKLDALDAALPTPPSRGEGV